MALNRNVLVEMPTEKVVLSIPNKKGDRYVRYLISSSRKGKKHANNKRICIGIKDEKTSKLIPNANYFDIFKETSITQYTPKTIQSFGNFYLLYTLSLNCGLINCLEKTFPDIYREIFTIASFMLCEGNIMYHCDDFCDENYTINRIKLLPSTITNLFEKIDFDKRTAFFKDWLKVIPNNECIVYDSTSISTYGADITIAEYGYNKDRESLPQINLGLYYGQESELPLFYDVYNGSIRDKEHLESMKAYAKTYGIDKLSFVMDRGYCKKDNLEYLYKEGISFIMGASLSYDDIKEVFPSLIVDIQKSSNRTTYPSINGVSKQMKLFGVPITLHLYYSHLKMFEEINRIDTEVLNLENELISLKDKVFRIDIDLKEKFRKYEKYFKVQLDLEENKMTSFEVNYQNIDKAKELCGYFAIMSSRLDYDASLVLIKYRKKDGIEKVFDNLKNHIDMSRLRVHSNEVMDGKIFVAFISLIIKSRIEFILNYEIIRNQISTSKVLRELSKIKITTLHNNNQIILALTRLQKEILSKFNLSESILKEGVNSLFY